VAPPYAARRRSSRRWCDGRVCTPQRGRGRHARTAPALSTGIARLAGAGQPIGSPPCGVKATLVASESCRWSTVCTAEVVIAILTPRGAQETRALPAPRAQPSTRAARLAKACRQNGLEINRRSELLNKPATRHRPAEPRPVSLVQDANVIVVICGSALQLVSHWGTALRRNGVDDLRNSSKRASSSQVTQPTLTCQTFAPSASPRSGGPRSRWWPPQVPDDIIRSGCAAASIHGSADVVYPPMGSLSFPGHRHTIPRNYVDACP